ncbi:MAG: IS200/IS605 family transposase [Oscillospiraceae bacterium]|nr:IS200/IS605 family transposase [Oscillospiraceae bacterium]
MKNEIKHTAHSSYRCEYHIVFGSKYRRKEIYGKLRKDIGEILRKLCEEKGVEIIEAKACPDHIHMLVSIPPHLSVAQFMGFLKSKSALMIFDRHANLKYKYGRRNFWSRGYFVDTVGKNERVIQEYIKNQQERDYAQDQVTLKEYMDPFTGNKCK